MQFNSFVFLCGFLPAALILFRIFRSRQKVVLLLILSFLFYAWAEPRIWILLFYILFNFTWGKWVGCAGARQKFFLATGILLNLAPLLFFKYSSLFGAKSSWVLPLGISFFGFQGISYLVDIYRGLHLPQRSLLKYAFFKSFFAPLIAGPLFRYSNITNQIDHFYEMPVDGVKGLQRFMRGLGKKVILADPLAGFVDLGFQSPEQLSFALTWLVLFAFSLQIYFDFSGYSDMAIGLHDYFGLSIPENFNRPFQTESLTEFWRRWHMTLTKWFRDYVYFPLGGNKQGQWVEWRNKFVVFLLCGLWHGGTWLFAIWGLFHGMILVFERILSRRDLFPTGLHKTFGRLYVFVLVSFSWIFFRSPTSTIATTFIRTALGLSTVNPDPVVQIEFYHFNSPFYYLIGIIAFCMAFDLIPNKYLKNSKIAWIFHLGILLLSFLMMMQATHHPFIYFRF